MYERETWGKILGTLVSPLICHDLKFSEAVHYRSHISKEVWVPGLLERKEASVHRYREGLGFILSLGFPESPRQWPFIILEKHSSWRSSSTTATGVEQSSRWSGAHIWFTSVCNLGSFFPWHLATQPHRLFGVWAEVLSRVLKHFCSGKGNIYCQHPWLIGIVIVTPWHMTDVCGRQSVFCFLLPTLSLIYLFFFILRRQGLT